MKESGYYSPNAPDVDAALRKLGHYCRASGVPARLIDAQGETLGAFDRDGNRLGKENDAPCGFCALSGPAETEEETRVHLSSAYEAERFGGPYIYFCPHSFLFWSAPIVADGIMRAAFIGGPVLVLEVPELIEELTRAGKLGNGSTEAARTVLSAVPRVQPDRATSLAEVLADIAATLGIITGHEETNRDTIEQQSRISEYIHDLKVSTGKSTGRPYPIAKERELLSMISRGDKSGSQRLLNEILGHVFFSSGQDVGVIRARVLELVVLLSRAALEGGADTEQIFGLNYTYLNRIQHLKSVEEIAYWLSKIMVRFTDLVFILKDVKHAVVIQKARQYIGKHYTEKITLDDVASAVFLSPAYFSKVFNEEMETSFTAYLNGIRIEQSKTLLRNSTISLVDVAGLVGFEDQSYFTKVFKRIAGISPGRYRETIGRVPPSQEIHEERGER